MISDSIIARTSFKLPLRLTSVLELGGVGRSKRLEAAVILTSLIDAFSILVIYLLFNFSTTGEVLSVSSKIKLPEAELGTQLTKSTSIKVIEGNIYVEDAPVAKEKLTQVLIGIRKKLIAQDAKESVGEASLILQADRAALYKELSTVVQAGSHAGFSEIKFAVLGGN